MEVSFPIQNISFPFFAAKIAVYPSKLSDLDPFLSLCRNVLFSESFKLLIQLIYQLLIQLIFKLLIQLISV